MSRSRSSRCAAIDEEHGERLDRRRAGGGATVTGVLWIESKWGTAGDDAKALATEVGDPSLRGAKLRTAAWEMLATRLARPPLVPETVAGSAWPRCSPRASCSTTEVDGGLAMTRSRAGTRCSSS